MSAEGAEMIRVWIEGAVVGKTGEVVAVEEEVLAVDVEGKDVRSSLAGRSRVVPERVRTSIA